MLIFFVLDTYKDCPVGYDDTNPLFTGNYLVHNGFENVDVGTKIKIWTVNNFF